jgi:hypothetical protein
MRRLVITYRDYKASGQGADQGDRFMRTGIT